MRVGAVGRRLPTSAVDQLSEEQFSWRVFSSQKKGTSPTIRVILLAPSGCDEEQQACLTT